VNIAVPVQSSSPVNLGVVEAIVVHASPPVSIHDSVAKLGVVLVVVFVVDFVVTFGVIFVAIIQLPSSPVLVVEANIMSGEDELDEERCTVAIFCPVCVWVLAVKVVAIAMPMAIPMISPNIVAMPVVLFITVFSSVKVLPSLSVRHAGLKFFHQSGKFFFAPFKRHAARGPACVLSATGVHSFMAVRAFRAVANVFIKYRKRED